MATIGPKTIVENDGRRYILWETVTHADAGGVARISTKFPDKTITAVGTFAGSYARGLEGSSDNTAWVDVKNATGDAISFTAAATHIIADNLPYYRLVSDTAGTASDVDFYLEFAK
jgi:hypothetical protein